MLHKNAFTDEALFRFTPQYEASSFHSGMKHSAHDPYDEKMKNESCVCKYSLPMLHYSPHRRFMTKTHISFVLEISPHRRFVTEVHNDFSLEISGS